MATTPKKEEAKTVLKKRGTVEDIVANEKPKASSSKMPLKKRELPTESETPTPAPAKKAPALKKRELPEDNTETKEVAKKPTKKANPIDMPMFNKKVAEADDKPAKEKSSLDKMRERIAAQKRLEQDIMAEQALHNQEKDKLRGKLNALNKSLEEEAIEEEKVERAKPTFDFDLKSEALESQNKKLKQDLEKSKQQLQSLLALEFHNMKVLDENSLTLSNDFIEAINSIKAQADEKIDSEEVELKDQLSSLQKELSGLKAKNVAAQKASEEAQKVTAQAQRALTKAKKAIEEQENDQTRDFKKEIADLEKIVKDKEEELNKLNLEKEANDKEHAKKIEDLEKSIKQEAERLNKEINDKTLEINKLNETFENKHKEFENLVKENKVLAGEITKANEKIENAKRIEKENKTLNEKLTAFEENEKVQNELKEKLDASIKELEDKVNALEDTNKTLEKEKEDTNKVLEEKKALENKLEEQAKKIDELLIDYQGQVSDKNKEIESLREEIKTLEENINDKVDKAKLDEKDLEINTLKEDLEKNLSELNLNKEQNTLLTNKNTELDNKVSELENNNNDLQSKLNSLEEELNNAKVLYKENETLKLKLVAKEEAKPVSNNTELEEKANNYQNLLVSERNSHLQIEQKLTNELNEYKKEIEKLQEKLTQMSSNHGLTRLNQQVDVIEKFVNEMKENNTNVGSKDIYNSYYEKLILDYKEEQEKFTLEIEKRNKMLTLLRDEKINIVNILKRNGKNTSVLEKQIEDINTIINQHHEANDVVDSKKIEEEILNSIKEDLVNYCDNVKKQALKDIEEIDSKYENATNVSSLIKDYNDDCDNLTRQYSNEIVRLNLERELNKDENKQKAIEDKILMLEKQYQTLTNERDVKFNEAMSKLRKQSFEITRDQLENNYFAFVGEEYMNSLNQYSNMKAKVEEKIACQNEKYASSIESLKEQEETLLKENQNIKEEIARLNEKDDLEETEKLAKNQLLTSLKNNELKIENIHKNGFIQIEKDHEFIISKLEEDLKNIINEENKLREIYKKRESQAQERLEVEKQKEETSEEAETKQMINDYVYIKGEADRVILSVDEERQELLDAQELLDEIGDSKRMEKTDSTNDLDDALKDEVIDEVKKNDEDINPVIEDETNEVKETEPKQDLEVKYKENVRIPQDENVVVESVTEAKEPVSYRIKVDDGLDQKDLVKIKKLSEELEDIKYRLSENQDVLAELNDQYYRFTEAENTMSKDFKDVLKYKNSLNDRNILLENGKVLNGELNSLDSKTEKKAYKAKLAEIKSNNHKMEVVEKGIKGYSSKKQVLDYIKLKEKIKELKEKIQETMDKNAALFNLIEQKEKEIETLKG